MEEESGITFGEICHLIKKRIWWILGISVIVALVASLLVALVFNRGKNDYSLTFRVEFPGVSEAQYPDGTQFNYASMVYASQLEAAKASDEAFKNINIAAMGSNGGIRIEAETTTGANNATVLTGVYTVTASSAYFESADQASAFIRAVLGQTIATVNAKIEGLDFTAALSGYEDLTTYSAYGDRLAALRMQQNYLLERYAAVTGITQESDTNTVQNNPTYGWFVYNGKAISALYAEAQRATSTLNDLLARYESGGYVYYDAEADNAAYFARLAKQWADELKSNEEDLAFYEKQFNGAVITEGEYVEKVLTLRERNKTLSAQIKAIGYTYATSTGEATREGEPLAENAAFGEDVDALYEEIKQNSETAKGALVAMFAAESRINYLEPSIKTVVNTTNIILIAVAAFVVVFLLASIVFCAVDYPAYKKKRDAKRAAAVASPEEATELADKAEK